MIVTTVYVPPSANAREAEDILSSHAHDVDASSPDAAKLVTGDLNHCDLKKTLPRYEQIIVQELCESRGGHPGLSVLTSLLVSVDIKLY